MVGFATKIVLLVGILVSAVVSITIGNIAIDHNPQGEYDEGSQLLSLMGLWFGLVMIPFLIVAGVVEFMARRRNRKGATG